MSLVCRALRSIAAVGLLLSATMEAGAAEPSVRTVDLAQAQSMAQSGVTVIDVRRIDEWKSTGVIPGSLLITAFDASGQLVPGFAAAVRAQVPPDTPIVLICRTGNRSAKAAQVLVEEGGYSNLHNTAGGISEWARSGRPLGPCPSC